MDVVVDGKIFTNSIVDYRICKDFVLLYVILMVVML